MEVYGFEKGSSTGEDLREIAANVIKARSICGSEYFSAAEAFAGFSGAIVNFKDRGSLPERMEARRPLGPAEMPVSELEIPRVTIEEVYELAGLANDHIRQAALLPPSLAVRGSRVGAGSLFALFSAGYLDLISATQKPEYDVPPFDPYPRTNEDE